MQVFVFVFAGGFCERFTHGQGRPLFVVVHSAFSLPTATSPTLQGALKKDFWEAFVARDMSEPCESPSVDSSQKRYLWAHKEVDLAPQPVVGIVL